MKLSDLLFCGFFGVVVAGPHQFARQTTETNSHPTQVELRVRASTTVPARIEKRVLAPSNCGWINGIEASPLDCQEGATCIIGLNDNKGTKISAGGCCGSTGCNTFRTACSASRDACNDACKANPAILYCDNEDVGTLCATYSYPGGQSDLRCVKTKGNTLNIAFTYTGFSTAVPLPRLAANITICNTANSGKCTASLDIRTQTVNTATTTTKPNTSSSKPTNPTSTQPTSADPVSSTPTSTETSPPLSEKPQSATPAIVGGVVGGVGALGAILGAIFYVLFWKKRGAKKADHQPILPGDDASGASTNPALGATFKAELPATESRPMSTYPASFHDDPTKNTPEHPPERYEMTGIQTQQQQPLIMELDASEAQQVRRT